MPNADDTPTEDGVREALARLERTVAEMAKAVHRANSLLVPIINETSALLAIHRATETAVERLAVESKARTEHLIRLLTHADQTLGQIEKRLAEPGRAG